MRYMHMHMHMHIHMHMHMHAPCEGRRIDDLPSPQLSAWNRATWYEYRANKSSAWRDRTAWR